MKKILILDDIEVNVMLLKHIINFVFKEKETDVEIIECFTSLEFFEKFEEDIDLYFLDINLPGKYDGLDLLNHIVVTGVKNPIFMQTAYLEYNERALKLGATGIINKPYNKFEVKEIINKHLF
jgi:two-component system, sensor histidine kinase